MLYALSGLRVRGRFRLIGADPAPYLDHFLAQQLILTQNLVPIHYSDRGAGTEG